jgi:6-phosphogluconolactonase (cycloisomerase 2 family)
MRGVTSASATAPRWWVGSYGDGTENDAGGIWSVTVEAGRASARRVASSPAPSFLATSPDGRALFAVGETSPGLVVRYAVDADGELVERERVTSGGSGPCHLLIHPSGRALYVSQYGSGSLAVLPLVPDAVDGWRFAGGIGQVFEHSGRGPHERQAGTHVHSAVLVGDRLLALDLGTDELRRYRVGEDGGLAVDGLAARMTPGTGPRHAARTADGDLLVVGELSATLHLMAWDAERRVAVEVDVAPLGEPGAALPSHVTVTGGRVLVGVRGPDRLAAFEVAGGRLVRQGEVAVAAWPRHHAVAGPWVAVAAQGAHRVDVHRLGETPDRPVGVGVPAPACVIEG